MTGEGREKTTKEGGEGRQGAREDTEEETREGNEGGWEGHNLIRPQRL